FSEKAHPCPHLTMFRQICSYDIYRRQPPQDRKELRRVTRLLTDLPCPYIGCFCFWSCPAFRRCEGLPQINAQREFLPIPLTRLWQGHSQCQPCGEMRNRFVVCPPCLCHVPCLLPVEHGLLGHAGLGVVLRHQLGLGLNHVGKALDEHLRNALMVLLPGSLQQRLIGRVLNQGMLEEIRRLWRPPLLVQELCRY